MSKVLLSIDEHLLRRIDKAAHALGLSRSAFIARIATKELSGERGPGANKEARAALRKIDRLVKHRSAGKEDSTQLIRAMRDAR